MSDTGPPASERLGHLRRLRLRLAHNMGCLRRQTSAKQRPMISAEAEVLNLLEQFPPSLPGRVALVVHARLLIFAVGDAVDTEHEEEESPRLRREHPDPEAEVFVGV